MNRELNIPKFLANTELGSITLNEVEFKEPVLKGIEDLKRNFTKENNKKIYFKKCT